MRENVRKLSWRTAAAYLAVAALGAATIIYLHQRPLFVRLADGRIVPPWGLKANPHPVVESEVEEATKKFKRIHAAISNYRRTHGKLPIASSQLGLEAEVLSLSGYAHSDARAFGQMLNGHIALELLAPRPGGGQKPTFPKAGERDAWLSTDFFTRRNTVTYPDWSTRSNPSGFFLVLWSDGRVERVPVQRQLWVQIGNSMEATFPGQTGVPRTAKTTQELGGEVVNATPYIRGNPNAPGGRLAGS